jgi:hypothetical protein
MIWNINDIKPINIHKYYHYHLILYHCIILYY